VLPEQRQPEDRPHDDQRHATAPPPERKHHEREEEESDQPRQETHQAGRRELGPVDVLEKALEHLVPVPVHPGRRKVDGVGDADREDGGAGTTGDRDILEDVRADRGVPSEAVVRACS